MKIAFDIVNLHDLKVDMPLMAGQVQRSLCKSRPARFDSGQNLAHDLSKQTWLRAGTIL
jgi:hypothetical protein